MKRWAILVVLLYALMLVLLTAPLFFAYGLEYHRASRSWSNPLEPAELLELVQHWGWWMWLAVMVAGQALLLLVPVGMAGGRPVARRKLLVPMATAAFFLGNMCFAGGVALFCAAMPKDKGPDLLLLPMQWSAEIVAKLPGLDRLFPAPAAGASSEWVAVATALGGVLLLWMVWGWVFFRFARDDEAGSLIRRTVRWLVRGSILELLVAVPSHVMVRQRGDCCAPVATFWGITMGLTVMLMAFGPGVFFLFVERVRRLRPVGTKAGTERTPN